MSTLFGGGAAAAATSTTGDTSKDIEIPQAQLPGDGISDLSFSSAADFLAVSSWDQTVRIYEVSGNGVVGKWLFKCSPGGGKKDEVPLCVSWSKVCIVGES